jgi:uncharacterized protein
MPSAPGVALVKLVFDTNILVSGFLWHGPPSRLISAALQGRAQIFVSLTILLEFRETLEQPKLASRLAAQNETAESLANRLQAACHEAISANVIPPAELRDRDDLHVLACALAANADAIVTGDKDLLVMKAFRGIPIIDACEALKLLGMS